MDKPWEDLVHTVEQHKPGMVSKFHPRRYRTPPGYCSSRQIAIALAAVWGDTILTNRLWMRREFDLARYTVVARQLLELNVPLYHVVSDFANALLRTNIPAIPTDELNWAMPGAVFLLPQGVFYNPKKWPVEFLAVSVARPTDLENYAGRTGRFVFSYGTSIAEGTTHGNQISAYTGTIYEDQFATLDLLKGNTPLQIAKEALSSSQYPEELLVKEEEFLETLQALAINLMLALGQKERFVEMCNEPQVVTASRGFGQARRREPDQLWEPNWVGRKYRQTQEAEATGVPTGGTHARPRTHWRRGYWRKVLYGPMDADPRPIRRVLIDPVLINPDVGT